MPSIAAGAIIGKGGETIAQVQKDAGARVKMSKANDFYPGETCLKFRLSLVQQFWICIQAEMIVLFGENVAIELSQFCDCQTVYIGYFRVPWRQLFLLYQICSVSFVIFCCRYCQVVAVGWALCILFLVSMGLVFRSL